MSESYSSKTRKTVRSAVLLVGACFLVLAVTLRFQNYQSVVEQAEQLTLKNLKDVALTAAQHIDGDAHQRLLERYTKKDAITASTQDQDYLAIHKELKSIRTAFELTSPIYTYIATDDTHIQFGVTSSDQPYFRHSFTTAPEDQQVNYGKQGTLPVYEDEMGAWLSGYAPIFASDGKLVGMVQADAPFDHFIASARSVALKGIVWNVFMLAGLLALVYQFVARMLAREQKDKEALAEAVRLQTTLSEELKTREKELERNSKLLEQSNRDLTDFANIASHDLKSPLRGISSFAQLLARRSRASLDESSHEYLDFIISNANRALKLVDGLLSYAKADQDVRKSITFNLNSAAQDAKENLFSIIKDRNADLQIDDLPQAFGDETLITQVFQNLIGNGIKYNQSTTPEVYVSASVNDEGVTVFAVRDNGIGIAEEHQAHVFDMFSRLHSGDQYEGSGIGLAFCVRVVSRYGGTMWLESVNGEGSTFFFTLPEAVKEEVYA